jgi:lysophospholipase L1-like esterase
MVNALCAHSFVHYSFIKSIHSMPSSSGCYRYCLPSTMKGSRVFTIVFGAAAVCAWMAFVIGLDVTPTFSSSNELPFIHHTQSLSHTFSNATHKMCRTLPNSIDQWWYQNRENIIQSTIASQPHDPQQRALLESWLHGLLDFYAPSRLRRSSVVPAMTSAVQTILEIIDNYSESHVPLRIVVTGGSVTVGHGCSVNTIGLPTNDPKKDDQACAWPTRWEILLNDVLFQKIPVAQVKNMAVSATSTDITTEIFRSRIFPANFSPPDIVINAHGANDLLSIYSHKEKSTILQDFVQVVQNVRPCDPHLPLVMLLDDLRGGNAIASAMDHSALLYKVAAWFDVWHVNYANAVRRGIYGDVAKSEDYMHPLTTSRWTGHLGLGFHIGMAWTMLYNTVDTFIETCQSIESQVVGSVKGSDIHDQWLSKVQDPLSSYMEYESFGENWRHRLATFSTDCQSRMWNSTQPACEHAWIYKSTEHILTTEDIINVTASHLVASENWPATSIEGHGYHAIAPGAYLTFEYRNVTQPARSITIMYLRSGLKEFYDSTVRVDAEVTSADGTVRPGVSTTVHGSHELYTSVYYAHKVVLADGGAQPGESVRLSFRLLSGSRFRILGIAVCSL